MSATEITTARQRATLRGGASDVDPPTKAETTRGATLDPKLIVEFLGTFVLVLTVGMATSKSGAGILAPLAIGSALMVMVFAGAHVSGAHYNPAVTIAVLARGNAKSKRAVGYITTQLVAGALAGLLVRALDGAAHPAALASDWKIMVVEFLFTFILAYVVLNVATAKATEGNSFYGLAIGFTLATGVFTAGKLSGGAFNPAVALGGSVIGALDWSDLWIYVLANCLGGLIAAVVFQHLQQTTIDDGDTTHIHVPPELPLGASHGSKR
jgi:aquaporin Z